MLVTHLFESIDKAFEKHKMSGLWQIGALKNKLQKIKITLEKVSIFNVEFGTMASEHCLLNWNDQIHGHRIVWSIP